MKSPDPFASIPPYTSLPEPAQRREGLRGRLVDIGCWTPEQIAGKRWNIGCVALEITQRCNLDCTLCYLSDTSEAVKDVPLQEVFRSLQGRNLAPRNLPRKYLRGRQRQAILGDTEKPASV